MAEVGVFRCPHCSDCDEYRAPSEHLLLTFQFSVTNMDVHKFLRTLGPIKIIATLILNLVQIVPKKCQKRTLNVMISNQN